MGVSALPCPCPLFPSFPCVLLEKSQTQRISINCLRALSACIASLNRFTHKTVLTGSNVGLFFFFGRPEKQRRETSRGWGESSRASLRLRRPAFPHRTVPVHSLFGVGIVQKYFSLARQAHPSKHRAPVRRHTVISLPPLLYTKARLGDSESFPESSYIQNAVLRTPAPADSRELSTIVARPIMAFHAFVNDAAEAGQDPDITKPWTGIWLRHSCPPLWRLTFG